MVDAVTTTAAATTTTAKAASEKARTQLSGDFDTFLLMLTTQLKNQDPADPMDSEEFTAQLVQFAGVEQAIATNENLEKLISFNSHSEVSNAATYIGKYVEAKGDSARLQNGVASFSYDLPQQAFEVEIVIKDDAGRIVYKGAGPRDAGQNDVLWDGTTNVDGSGDMMPNGTYHIAVVAKDEQQKTIEATTYTTGFISAVDIEDGQAIYRIGDIELSLDDIRTVRDPMDLVSSGGGEEEESA
jgi:flagellar basal-body rod modification protein FlgD